MLIKATMRNISLAIALLSIPFICSAAGVSADLGIGYGQSAPSRPGGSYIPRVSRYTANLGASYQLYSSGAYLLNVGATYSPSVSPRDLVGGVLRNVRSGRNYSIYLKPEYVLNKTVLLYSKVGYARTTVVFNDDASRNVHPSGWVVGAGAEKKLTRKLAYFGEAKYAKFRLANMPYGGVIGPKDIDLVVGTRYNF